MAIYIPLKTSSHSPSTRAKPGKNKKSFSWLFRRKKNGLDKSRRQPAMVTGAQRLWKWKRLFRGAVLVGLLVAIVGMGIWSATLLLFKSTIFQLTDIKVTGTGVATQRQILDLAGLQQGGSLLRFDARAAAARIESHPWVERAEVKTNWPSAVEITVVEHQPFALVNLEEAKERRLYYINRSGRLFAEAGLGQELDFPVITGIRSDKDVEAGRLARGTLADAACSLLGMAAKGNAILPIQAISEIHVDQKQGLILYLVDRPFPVYFGVDRFPLKYNRLIKVLEQLYAKKQVDGVKEIRMDYFDDKVLVTGVQVDG
ncbi:MAG: FtsQ-type POTRA domain-containing protein [Proteobacteria bacterium]|nr:FtsQ-type POTRA domain-containing protein [Pseudomonadota bacterium]